MPSNQLWLQEVCWQKKAPEVVASVSQSNGRNVEAAQRAHEGGLSKMLEDRLQRPARAAAIRAVECELIDANPMIQPPGRGRDAG
jgi:hypothetical protein